MINCELPTDYLEGHTIELSTRLPFNQTDSKDWAEPNHYQLEPDHAGASGSGSSYLTVTSTSEQNGRLAETSLGAADYAESVSLWFG